MFQTKVLSFLATAGVAALLCSAPPAAAQTAPPLGTTASFAVLGGSTVTNTGSSIVTGDLGLWPGLSITGFPPGTVIGTTHTGDAVAMQAQSDLVTAYNNLAGQACNTNLTGQNLGGLTLPPAVYCFSTSAELTGTLTLDAQGNPAAVFVFQIGSSLTTASNAIVQVINGGSNCNIFWQVGSSATLGTTTTFAGNVFALTSITANTGSSISGRVLARNGAVTLDTTAVAVCAPVCPPITVNPVILPTGALGVPYSATISATGGALPYTFAVTAGTLPDGLTLSPGGLLDGLPTTLGTSVFTITATDANGCTGFRVYTITINPVGCPTMTILPDVLPNAALGSPYSQPITASGSTPDTYTYTVTAGFLPPGLALTPLTATKTVTLAGIPTTVGNYSFTITATDENGCQVSQAYTILVNPLACPTVTVLPATLPNPIAGVPYAETISATGGVSPYVFSVTAGALPPGLLLSPPTATPTASLSGIPTATGQFSFTITATDANGCPGTREYMVFVEQATGVPTVSTWGLFILIALTGLVSTWYLRKAA